jgi:hypothetical protein
MDRGRLSILQLVTLPKRFGVYLAYPHPLS